ncbi:tRNA preQ1(34) S-adenosylmethionine ribosyltransferase-isomerase QueA [Patescibacteria group bacterium]|nr:tRNA preQ1(34) S-adenosylmethionine ribosyltransferase-isomerase QueA [Patescibacteria group bacterium]
MYLGHFNYHLPKKYIAQKPMNPRDHSRLLILDKKTGVVVHRHFYDIGDYLSEGDVVVMNNSKVIPARLWGKKETGGKMEVFLLHKISDNEWEVLVGGKGQKNDLVITFAKGLEGKLLRRMSEGVWKIRFNKGGKDFDRIYKMIGEAPVPPYIKQKSDLKKYQTVYATKEGSVAAPTAGFHFTKNLMRKLERKGVEFQPVTLHVGLGTFQPVKVNDIKKHKMHPEFVEVPKETLTKLWQAKKEGKKIIAVGTTSVRVLETVMADLNSKKTPPKEAFKGWINLFIYPGFKFKSTDAMITNFHLPESTLLMLVSAFAGRKNILNAYETAKKKNYRFYSFGDAMLIK